MKTLTLAAAERPRRPRHARLAPAVTVGDFLVAQVLQRDELPKEELLARFRRAAPMLQWGIFDLSATAF